MRSDNYGDIFWQGYDRGHAAVAEYDEARRKGLARKGMRELDSATTSDPNAQQADAYARENAATAAQDNETFGGNAAPEDYMYGKPQLTEARGLVDSERYRRAESIYREQGFDDKAEQYGERSRVAGRQDKEDVRTARRDALSEKATGLQIRKGERDESRDVASDDFNQSFGNYMLAVKNGEKSFSVADVYGMKPKDMSVDDLNKVMLNQLGADEKVATAKVQERLRELGEAADKGVPAMLALADPDPTDNQMPTEVANKDGTTSIMYGGKELFKLPPAAPGISVAGMLYQEIKGRLEGNPLSAGIQFLAMEKTRTEIKKGEADIGESNAKAGLARRTDPNAGKGGNGNEKLTALTGYANSLNSQIANIDKALVNLDPKDPKAQALAIQRDRAYTSLSGVQHQIESERLGLAGPAPAAQASIPVGTIEDGHEYLGGNPADPASWKAVAAPSPASRSAPKPEAPNLVISEEEKRNLWASEAAGKMGLKRKPERNKYRELDPRGVR